MNDSSKSSKYKIRELSDSEAQTWDSFIDNSEKGTIFHKFHWLKSAEQHSKTKLFLLVCEKAGEGVICVFPVFLLKKFFLNILFSPPPGCFMPELGPVYHLKTYKQYKIESDYYNSTKAYDSYISKKLRSDYFLIFTNICDVRAYKWLGYSVDPNYTYRLDLNNDTNRIFENFSKSIRNQINKIKKNGKIEIKQAQLNKAENLINEIKKRYSELNMPFKLRYEYIRSLVEIYGGKELKLHECFFNGAYQTTFITIEYKNNMKIWLGAVHNKKTVNGINEFIHWNNIQDASKRFFEYYERIGANTKHLCEHKSKYGFSPEVYYKMEKWSTIGRILFYIFTKF